VLPFVLPNLEHLDERVDLTVRHAIDVEGLQLSTTKRWRVAYRSLLRFLRTTPNPDRFLSGDARVQQVLLEGWIAWLRIQGRSRNAIATYWRGAAALAGRIAREEGLFNPFLLVPAPKENLPQPRYLTRVQAEGLLRYIQNTQWRSGLEAQRNLCIFGLMMLAGLRRQEILRLTTSDVQLGERTLRIRAGKGRNGGRDRTAYMTPQLATILERYLRERMSAGRTHPELLTSLASDRALGLTPLVRIFRAASRALGYPLTPHMLRHTYATLLRQSGVADRVAMDLLGHRSLVMLQRYSHVIDGEHAQEAARLELHVDL
jgi:integrase